MTLFDKLLVKLLHRISPEKVIDYLFKSQSKPKGFEDMNFVFFDSKGVRYYEFRAEAKMSIHRKGAIDEAIYAISRGLSGPELDKLVTEIESTCEVLMESPNPKVTAKQLTKIYGLSQEIKLRQSYYMPMDSYWDLVALLYIREDEDPRAYIFKTHEEKVKQLKKDANTGLYDHFFLQKLKGYIPFLNNFTESLQEMISENKKTLEKVRSMLEPESEESGKAEKS